MAKKVKMKLPVDSVKMYRDRCPRCGEPLILEPIGIFGEKTPVGFMPVCSACTFRDWGHVL